MAQRGSDRARRPLRKSLAHSVKVGVGVDEFGPADLAPDVDAVSPAARQTSKRNREPVSVDPGAGGRRRVEAAISLLQPAGHVANVDAGGGVQPGPVVLDADDIGAGAGLDGCGRSGNQLAGTG